MAIPIIVTGDDADIFVTLTKDDATFTIAPADTVEAAIVSVDHETLLMAAVSQSEAAAGADWANSLVAVEFTAAQTALIIKTGHALLAVQATISGKKTTWFDDVGVVQGQIS